VSVENRLNAALVAVAPGRPHLLEPLHTKRVHRQNRIAIDQRLQMLIAPGELLHHLALREEIDVVELSQGDRGVDFLGDNLQFLKILFGVWQCCLFATADSFILESMSISVRGSSVCVFCDILPDRIEVENDLAYCIYDGFPVTPFHALIIPKRHAETYFDLTGIERDACHQLMVEMKLRMEKADASIDGFNIGMNSGRSAGQTVFHCHIHLIPRRSGDMADPRGGVRGVIPGKQKY
jgi:diadenosine tetraphosphate (Ap4A) HIT family hydrolase